jgi:hypothetical protein
MFNHSGNGKEYCINGVEIFGDNNLTISPKPLPPPEADGTYVDDYIKIILLFFFFLSQYLHGGNWKVQRGSLRR